LPDGAGAPAPERPPASELERRTVCDGADASAEKWDMDASDEILNRHHVVVVGAGFGGLETVHRLAGAPVRITLVDRRNHHLFQPLLYQVATASLAPSEIAWPIRTLFRKRPEVEVATLLASVEAIDKEARRVRLDDGSRLRYDTLVPAPGARHAYFGHDDWEPFAPGLKTLEDATTIRGRILLAFERAEREPDGQKRAALMTFVIVGAGPAGVELAGTIVELARATLPADFRTIDTSPFAACRRLAGGISRMRLPILGSSMLRRWIWRSCWSWNSRLFTAMTGSACPFRSPSGSAARGRKAR
jgi:NADPH-dependent 2,4-dienoyl-CoA reductase/sulfur reductase-like enzyme